MSIKLLQEIAASIHQARYFASMADEATYSSNKEHVVCFRWILSQETLLDFTMLDPSKLLHA